MRWNDVIDLIKITKDKDSSGFATETESDPKTVYANSLPVRSNEFYQADRAGYRIEKAFEIHRFEYEGETKVIHNNQEYEVIRTYENGEKVELYCERRDDDHG